jgi:hypothetical protein
MRSGGKVEGRKKVDELTLPHRRPQDPQQQQAGGGPPVGPLLRIQVRGGMLKLGARGRDYYKSRRQKESG